MKKEHEARAWICKECPELVPLVEICKKCGCFMPAKVRLDFAECPMGKWSKITRDSEGRVINSEDNNPTV